MFAVAGTEIYSVNLSDGSLTSVLDFPVMDWGRRERYGVPREEQYGPEPSTWAMTMLGFAGPASSATAPSRTPLARNKRRWRNKPV